MADEVQQLKNGPAESSLVRNLLYLGDGLVFGVVLYGGVIAAVTISVWFFLTPVFVIVFLVALPKIALLLSSKEARRGSITLQEWYEIRQLRWIAVLGSLVAGLLVVGSILVWAWTWPVRSAVLVTMGGVLLGGLVRVAGIYLIEQHNPEPVERYQ